MIALAEKGTLYELVAPNLMSPEYATIHPFRKVPVLAHDGYHVFETLAIVEYVDQVFPGRPLFARELKKRIATLEWISAFLDEVASSVLEYCVRERFAKRLMGLRTDEAAIAAHVPDMDAVTQILDHRLRDSPFIAGETFTPADMFFGPVYLYFRETPEGDRILLNCLNVRRWNDDI